MSWVVSFTPRPLYTPRPINGSLSKSRSRCGRFDGQITSCPCLASIIIFHKFSFVTTTVSLSTHVTVLLQPCNGIQISPILTNTSERQNRDSSPTSVSPEQRHRHYVTSCSSSLTSGVCRPNRNFSPSNLALKLTTSGGNSRSHRKG